MAQFSKACLGFQVHVIMYKWIFMALAAVPFALTLERPAASPNVVWWVANALEKIHPYDHEPKELNRAINISAARNEFEPFQVVLKAEAGNINNVDVDVTDLRGPADAVLSKDSVTPYFERYIELKMPSSIDGGAGEWPDPLVPRVDHYLHERRNAFPFNLSKDRNQPLWFDVYVPPAARPGIYEGQVHILISGKVEIGIPLRLEVWNFTLPSTSSLPTAFGFSGLSALRQHFGKYTSDKDLFDITTLYEKAGLAHRITIDGSSGVQPAVSAANGKVHINWDDYDRQVGPFMDGRVFSANQPLYGARATAIAQHTLALLKRPDEQIQFWRQVAEHFRQKGWIDRLFNYLWDEPNKNEFARMAGMGKLVHQADPELKNLVTAPFRADWSDFIDIWTPVINCFEPKPQQRDYCDTMVARSGYDTEIAKGKTLWWYQSCASHGCNVVGGEYFRGWPSYVIDADGIRNRIMEWLAWKYSIGGELYFSTDEAFGKKDPWTDVNLFGGNGDGTLFYPGTPGVIGGTSHIPIESIRLKLIREGLEDYEYLVLLSKLDGSKRVNDLVSNFIRNTYDFDHDPQKLYSVRTGIGRELSKQSPPTH
jgi:hypothetical protein